MSAASITRGERTASGALALGMHLLFAVLLVFGVTWQQKRSDAPVVADLWSNLPPAPQPKVETPPPEVKPAPEPPKPAPAPKAEPKPVFKPDIALKEKAEKERKRRAEEKAEQERKRQEKEKAEVKKREEDKKRLAALKEQQAKDEVRRREEAQRKLAAQQAAQASAQQRLIDDYTRRVRDKIRPFVPELPNLQGNPEAEFEVVQIPGGEVLTVKLKRSSGNPAYDAAVERAIYRAHTLPPRPAGLEFAVVRELTLKFRPKE